MKKLNVNQMENLVPSGWWEDVVVGASCGATILLAATPAAPLAIMTGNACVVGLIGYALDKY